MSNRTLKIQLFNEDPRCYWCGCVTILTNESNIKGHPNPKMSTIDHIISRYLPQRWLSKSKSEQRKVLACYECNHGRSVQETLCLSRAEILRRSKGYSLSPRGKPKIIKPLPTIKEVLDKLNA